MGVLGPHPMGSTAAQLHIRVRLAAVACCQFLFFPRAWKSPDFPGVRGVEPCRQLALCPWSCGKRQPGHRPCPVQSPGSAGLCLELCRGQGWDQAEACCGVRVPQNHPVSRQTLLCPLSQTVGLWRVRGQQELCSCSAPCVTSLPGLRWFPRLVTSPLERTVLVQIFGKAQEPPALPDAYTAPTGDGAEVLGCSWGHRV